MTRFGVKVQYKHIVISAQINLKDYSNIDETLLIGLLCQCHYEIYQDKTLTPGNTKEVNLATKPITLFN